MKATKDLVMPGSTEEDFINRFIKDLAEKDHKAPTNLVKINEEIRGILRWHRVIGSTPPAWVSSSLAIKIYQAKVRTPWFDKAV